MNNYTLEARGDVRELYHVTAKPAEEAEEKFRNSELGRPYLIEASTDIHSVTLDD